MTEGGAFCAGRAAGLASALALVAAAMPPPAQAQDAARLDRFLATAPVIDGHNDLPWELGDGHGNRVEATDLRAHADRLDPPLQTDIARLRAGGYGAQFWSVWVPASYTGGDAVLRTLEAIDIVRRMVAAHPSDLMLATSADGIMAARASGRIASLIGVEGGHQIAGSPGVLRQYHALGVRYMTLTHSRGVGWADSATDAPDARGLTGFGRAVIAEMNRIGMIVDLSHVSPDTARAALAVTRAPVIFSHSNAAAVNPHPRNVPDDVLALTARGGGVVMVNVYPPFVSAAHAAWDRRRTPVPLAERPAWDAANPPPRVTAADVADHVEHVARVAGIDHVGLGGDYDGIGGTGPEGMRGADGWRLLFAELMRRGWSDGDLAKLAGDNVLRVLHQVERVAMASRDQAPMVAPVLAEPESR